MKIGLSTMSVSRQSGGLLWAVRPLARHLTRTGCRINIFAGEDSDTHADMQNWQGLNVTTKARYGPAFFGYMPALYSALRNADLDLLHTHGLWMYPSVAALTLHRKQNRPLVISPHGMLDSWALNNSAWKKRLAGRFYENAHLHAAACLHALTLSEYQAIRNYGLQNPVAIIPNGVELADEYHEWKEPEWNNLIPSGSRALLFLSRIHPKKGLVSLIRGFAQVKQETPTSAQYWHLVIAGWEQQGSHQEELEELIADFGLRDSIHFVGPQFGDLKIASLIRADAFVLPSLSEGLPMAVLEAWSYRLPVLMTPQCNLPEGFTEKAAIDMLPEAESIAVALIRLFQMTDTERRTMGSKGRDLVEQRFTWPAVAARMSSVYSWILDSGPKPACVLSE